MPKPEECSCTESQHLRAALTLILDVATQRTRGSQIQDLAIIGRLVQQALDLDPLVGEPAICSIEKYLLGNT